MLVPLAMAAVLLAVPTPPPDPSPVPLACRLDALTDAQRDRHRRLSESLAAAATSSRELPNGYEITLDLSRLRDARGLPYCVVEVAEWVDLESRCCPFVDFGIDASGRGGPVRLRLTGAGLVKEFLEFEMPILKPSR